MTDQDEHALIAQRREKLKALRDSGNAFPNDFRRDAIAGELIDGAFIFVDLLHQDFETTVHYLMDFLRIKLFRDGGVIGHISE